MSSDSNTRTRRSLLQVALRGTAVAGVAGLFPALSRAANPGVGRASVCIYLFGGNDSNNMIVPLDPNTYSAYAAGRGELALPQDVLLPVSSSRQNGGFGFHPNLAELRDLYSSGTLAVLANTGLLITPLNKASVAAKAGLPDGLFHHESAAYARYLPSASPVPPWAPELQQQDTPDAAPQVFRLGGVSMMSPRRLGIPGPPVDNPALVAAIQGVGLATPFPRTPLGAQLHRIARLLKAGPGLGMDQQIFSAQMGGFDTHLNQLSKQGPLFTELSQAMAAFYAATQELGIAEGVVTYTQTEFNRALRPNRTHGSDHGWGGHELVMGGSLRGGDIYGTFPSLVLGGPDDAGNDGVWIPTTSNQQCAATVAYWFGVGAGQLPIAVDGLQNFPANSVGFLG